MNNLTIIKSMQNLYDAYNLVDTQELKRDTSHANYQSVFQKEKEQQLKSMQKLLNYKNKISIIQ